MITLLSLALSLLPATASTSDARCQTELIHSHSRASLPASCRSLGRLRLGEPIGLATSVLGAPDARTMAANGAETLAWIVPRTLNHALQRRPVTAHQLKYGVVYVVARNGRIVSIRDESGGLAPNLGFAGLKAGDAVGRADTLFGRPQVSRAGDYRSYPALPIAIHTDDEGTTIEGFDIAERSADLVGGEARGEPQKDGTGMVQALRLRFGR